MILHLDKKIGASTANQLAVQAKAFLLDKNDYYVMVLPCGVKEIPAYLSSYVLDSWVMPTDMQLSSSDYFSSKHKI